MTIIYYDVKQNIPYFIHGSHIHVHSKSQILSNNLDCTYHLRILVFLFFLPLFCSGMMVYLGSCRMVCIVDLGDSNFFSTGLPSFTFLPPSFFVYLHSNLLPWNLLFSGWGGLCTDGHCGPHLHNSSDDFLFGAELLRTIGRVLLPAFIRHFLYLVSPPS